jgi:hypothetical protein
MPKLIWIPSSPLDCRLVQQSSTVSRRGFFFRQRCTEKIRCVRPIQMFSHGNQGAVAGNLVVLNFLRRADQSGVQHCAFFDFFEQLLGLLNQPFHGHAFHAFEFQAR